MHDHKIRDNRSCIRNLQIYTRIRSRDSIEIGSGQIMEKLPSQFFC